MSKRYSMTLVVLLVCAGALRSDSAGRADGPKRDAPVAKGVGADEGMSLLLAIDSLQETLAEQRSAVAETERRLTTERARQGKLEERLAGLQARTKELKAGRNAKQ